MGYHNKKEIDNMEKLSRRQQFLDDHPEITSSTCKYAFGMEKCTSGSNPSDYCSKEPENCPYND